VTVRTLSLQLALILYSFYKKILEFDVILTVHRR